MITEKAYIEDKYHCYANPGFITDDPIQVPKRFTSREDIEIAGFFAATIAWGQRKTIIANANRLIGLMDNSPADFVRHHSPAERMRFAPFVHRTFSAADVMYFLETLQHLYRAEQGLEGAFIAAPGIPVYERLVHFHTRFFALEHLPRTRKHVSNPAKGSAAKRLNMFLRWMVRTDAEGVDFGLWKHISPAELMIPLDVHTGTVARRLGLLSRGHDDWKAVEELTANLRRFDPQDPVKYDFALFGIGVNEGLSH